MKTVRLGDVCNVVSGGTPPKGNPDFWGGDILWASVRDMKNPIISRTEFTITYAGLKNSSTNLIPKNNVIIASRVGLGKVCWLQNDTAINQDLRAIIPKDDNTLDKTFLFWWLRSVAWKIEKAGVGATVKGVKLPFIKGLEIPVLSLEEQRRIVARLDAAFERISAAEVLMRQNLDNVAALQKSILHKYLSALGNTHTHRLGAICNFVRGPFGGNLKKEYFKPEGYAVYEQRHAIYGMETPIRYFIDEKKFGEMKRFEVMPGDLLMSCSGTIGKISIVPKDVKQGVINQALLKFTPKKDVINARFLKYLVESRGFQEAIREHSGGSAIQNVASVKILKEIDVSLPPIAIQERVVRQIEDANKTTASLQEKYLHKLSMLKALRSSMLREAFSTTNTV